MKELTIQGQGMKVRHFYESYYVRTHERNALVWLVSRIHRALRRAWR